MHGIFRILKVRTYDQIDVKLTIDQFGLLYAIDRNGEEVIQKDMAKFMEKDASAVLRMIDSLEDKELVVRVVDKNDRRKNKIMVTKKGEKVIEQLIQIEMQLDAELMQGLPNEDIDTFYKVIDHIQGQAKRIS